MKSAVFTHLQHEDWEWNYDADIIEFQQIMKDPHCWYLNNVYKKHQEIYCSSKEPVNCSVTYDASTSRNIEIVGTCGAKTFHANGYGGPFAEFFLSYHQRLMSENTAPQERANIWRKMSSEYTPRLNRLRENRLQVTASSFWDDMDTMLMEYGPKHPSIDISVRKGRNTASVHVHLGKDYDDFVLAYYCGIVSDTPGYLRWLSSPVTSKIPRRIYFVDTVGGKTVADLNPASIIAPSREMKLEYGHPIPCPSAEPCLTACNIDVGDVSGYDELSGTVFLVVENITIKPYCVPKKPSGDCPE